MSGYNVIENGRVLTIADGTMPSYFVGLDASKTPNPSVGDKYAAFNTGKEYTCFVSSVWSLVSSPCYDEYSNHTGAFDALNYGRIFGTIDTNFAEHYFNFDLDSELSWNRLVDIRNETFELNYTVTNVAEGTFTGADEAPPLYTLIGLSFGSIEINVHQYLYSVIEGGSMPWYFITNDGVTSEKTEINDIVDGDLITFKNYGNIIMLFVNGTLKATHSTTAFTSATAYPSVIVQGSGSGTGRTLGIDNISWRIYK